MFVPDNVCFTLCRNVDTQNIDVGVLKTLCIPWSFLCMSFKCI